MINKYQINLFIAFLVFAAFKIGFPQSIQINFESLTVSDGLSHNSGICMLQDKKGFIWIGTQNGLCRYDGYSIKKFQNIPGDTSSLPGNFINSIFADHSGTIWVGTNQDGLAKYNPYKNNFTSYKNSPENSFSIGAGSVYSIAEDGFNNLWVAVNPSGLYLFDREQEKFYHFTEDSDDYAGFKGDRAFCVHRENTMLILTHPIFQAEFISISFDREILLKRKRWFC